MRPDQMELREWDCGAHVLMGDSDILLIWLDPGTGWMIRHFVNLGQCSADRFKNWRFQ